VIVKYQALLASFQNVTLSPDRIALNNAELSWALSSMSFM
jgi:hypothetical protein